MRFTQVRYARVAVTWRPDLVVAVILTFIGDRLSLDLYLVALINFGFRIFNNVALIRRHFI